MKKALRAAERGRGRVEPNPMVGAVLAKTGKLLATGWHKTFGGPHAEIDAFKKISQGARGATLYVTLEPCSHYGKTPPCADAIIRAGISRVIAAMKDPFPQVSGRGFCKLRQAGIQVESGLLAAEAERLNAPYLKMLRQRLPFVTLKWAMTLDGRIATVTGDSKWISGPASRKLVHRMRSKSNCVMIGVNTALFDDPELTVRHVRGRNPLRIVVDSRGRLPIRSKIAQSAQNTPTIVATTQRASQKWAQSLAKSGVEVIRLPARQGRVDLKALMRELSRRGVCTVLVEGGAHLAGALMEEGLADRLAVFIGPKICLDGLAPLVGRAVEQMAKAIRAKNTTVRKIGNDFLIEADIL